jgi:hypothetical protein
VKKLPTVLLRIGAILVILIAILLFLLLVALPSSERWAWSQTLASALSNARSVTFVEFTSARDSDAPRSGSHEIELQRINATPEQIKSLRSATSRFFVFSYYVVIPSCFTPHHRVEVVRRDGSAFQMEISFDCWDFRFDHRHEEPIPLSWLPLLRKFFSDLGMPPRMETTYKLMAEQKAKAELSPKNN